MSSDETVAFEHYRVLRREDGAIWELGRGAMGVTYKAIDDNLHKVVALKVINAFHVERESSRDRFLREARAAASLTHRNVATVYHLGHNAQNFFYAMEFIDGETVEALVKRAGPRPWQEALEITIQVARALAAAHEKRLVHRDIKPANIMLVPESGEDYTVVKLIDFGLAKTLLEEGGSLVHTSASGFVGTPLYASPEQCNEDAPDIRSDIYSLGVTLWFMLTGQPPFQGPLGKVFAQHLGSPPPWDQLPADVPEPVRALLARMLAKDRAGRPQTPADLRRELDASLREPPAPDPAPTLVGALVTIRPLPAVGTNTLDSTDGGQNAVPPPATPHTSSRGFWGFFAVAILIGSLALAGYWASQRKSSYVVTSAGTPTPPPTPETVLLPTVTPTAVLPKVTPVPTPDSRLVRAKAWIAAAGQNAGLTSNVRWKATALRRIAAAQAKAGDMTGSRRSFAAALQMAETIMDDSAKATALANIAAEQAKSGDVAGSKQNFAAALQTAETIMDDSTKVSCLSNIAAAQVTAGDLGSAMHTAESINDDFQESWVMSKIITAQAKAGNVATALQTALTIKTDSEKAIALAHIAAAQAEAGDVAGSRQNFAAALQTAENITEDSRKPIALAHIAAAHAKADDIAESIRIFAAARRAADAINDNSLRSTALHVIALEQIAAGDLQAALGTAQNIKDDNWNASTWHVIASAQARQGDVASALRTAEVKIKDDTRKALVFGDVAAAQFKAGDNNAAEALLASLTAGRNRCSGYLAAAAALLEDPLNPDND